MSSVAVSEVDNPGKGQSVSNDFPTLFSPLRLSNGVTLPNRAMMGSMHTGLEGHSIPPWFQRFALGMKHPHVTSDLDAMAQYFQERAEGGVGLMVTGGIAPNYEGWTGPFAAKLNTEDEMNLHKVVTDAVHSIGSGENDKARICMQILHTGRYAYHPFAVSASNTKSPISPFKARALSESGIRSTIGDFVKCASLAQQAGYDGVEVMASEGYLLSQFLSPCTNLRDDKYGGSLENRARLPLEIVQNIRKECGDDFIIIFRLSLLDLVDGGLNWNECVQLAQWVEASGATIINTGIGWHESRIPTIATSVPRGAFVQPTLALKQTGLIGIPLVATNRINSPQVAEDILRRNASDLVSMARPFLADANFLLKAQEGRADEINTCIGCNQACLDHAFVGKTASCLVNPRAGQESSMQKPTSLPEDQRRTIGIVGAGPAGCAFAVTAAQRGHDVILYDQAAEIGGQFHMAKRIPGKEEFHETLRYFRTMLMKHGVDLRLSTTLTFEDMKQNAMVDKWIIATGVRPRALDIPGADHPKVLSYIDVLKHNAPVGGNVAIIGAGGIGFDVAEFLLHHDGQDKVADDVNPADFLEEWGVDPSNLTRGGLTEPRKTAAKRKLVLLQRKEGKLGANLGRTTGWIHRTVLAKSGVVEMLGGVTYEKVDENGHLHIINNKGQPQVLEVDNIIACAGQTVFNDLELRAKGTNLEKMVYAIGGAYQAGELDAKRAIDMGTRLAMEIHREEVIPGKHKFEAPTSAEEEIFHFLKKWA
eukprot:CAMPEP_0194200434 /NCGR_PEP_ID=MMETSP0156-20130528/1036_1 /TAXON_ID=33649 /ORGANISM="Thalassionema nitzschioides, Strain L26-B" /LENGTH=761 /DNA_ID=CAMNT_0038925427 /DNA_START=189 /DNA_END=2474 /DNA_ORIENTATION=+